MPERRPRVPLVFGSGHDRDLGIMASQPGHVEDVRNLILHEGRATLRPGFRLRGILELASGGSISHVIGGRALRSEGVGVVVGYSEGTGRVQLYRMEPDASAAEFIGDWFSVAPGADPPRVWLAESFGRIYMAHDEPRILQRAPTFVYDFIFPGGQPLRPLEADFLNEGEHQVFFRGVVGHLDYLFGWGYGSPEEDRPELVRSSLPGEPSNFDPEHYFIAGDRRDPVLQCVPGARDLVVFKGAEWHAIVGYDRRTFGIRPRDPLHGLLAPGLAVNVSGNVLFWSPEGPMVTDGADPAESLERDLDLQGFEPADLVERGEMRNAIAIYFPGVKVVGFFFGRRGYAISLKKRGQWGYWPIAFDIYSAFTLYDTTAAGQVGGATGAYPEFKSAEAGGTFADVLVENHNIEGGELLEVWVSDFGANSYSLRETVADLVSAEITVRVGGLEEASTYDVSLRYRRGTQIDEAYSGPPQGWPAISKGVVNTTIDPPEVGIIVPTIGERFSGTLIEQVANMVGWERTDDSTEVHRFRIHPAYPGAEIRVYRREAGTAGPDVLIETIPAADPRTAEEFFILEVEIPDGEKPYLYRARTWIDPVESPLSAGLRMWAGPGPEHTKFSPPAPAVFSVFVPTPPTGYDVGFTRHPEWHIEHWDNLTGDSGPGAGDPSVLRNTATPTVGLDGFASFTVTGITGLAGAGFVVSLRYKATAFGVDDFSEFVGRGVQVP